ncbi:MULTISPECIES: DUF6894 family protein [Methylobacterium]|uniref:DUF6894 family protein n=1 Tax=Methylobacterium TaxID=407 RepID=UPI00104C85D9|nr:MULTISPECIES: hypothetical protein [Methylobacterium]MDR7038058.1 hypothetical protein [Methylobacterium sp. BE186]
MALYFFEFLDPEFLISDDEGTECADHDAALGEALRTLCEVAADQPHRYLGRPLRIEILDDEKRSVLSCHIQLGAIERARSALRSAA